MKGTYTLVLRKRRLVGHRRVGRDVSGAAMEFFTRVLTSDVAESKAAPPHIGRHSSRGDGRQRRPRPTVLHRTRDPVQIASAVPGLAGIARRISLPNSLSQSPPAPSGSAARARTPAPIHETSRRSKSKCLRPRTTALARIHSPTSRWVVTHSSDLRPWLRARRRAKVAFVALCVAGNAVPECSTDKARLDAAVSGDGTGRSRPCMRCGSGSMLPTA